MSTKKKKKSEEIMGCKSKQKVKEGRGEKVIWLNKCAKKQLQAQVNHVMIAE